MALAPQSPIQPYSSNPQQLKTLQPKFADELLARTDTLISRIRPTYWSLHRRWAITEYVTAIVKRCFSPHDVTAEPFGSVPLKTYLPDGDIDLSIYSYSPRAQALKEALRDTWATQLQLCLEEEANNPKSIFRVANVQVIHAEVKLLKCLVDNIVVDISFFQTGGLNTYRFLEDVDKFVDQCIPVRKHLFKDSIILVKGWCYYESRVLGAHHGLISTYALETLVLYVINLYHRELTNPLQVLYKFLVECSGFDWERFCLSLQGPIPLASFPNPTVEKPEALQRDALLTDAFMSKAHERYTQSQLTGEPKPFIIKQLNVMDPILPNNNLGRSVSKASYLRIRRAFEHGARMLADIAEQAKELGPFIGAKGFDNFFGKVWNAQRHDKHLAAAAASELANSMPLGAQPGLHHPVALRPMPQPFPHVPVPPPPSTSAPPISSSGPSSIGSAAGNGVVSGGASSGHASAAAAATGHRGSLPQVVYGNIAGDLHMTRRSDHGPGQGHGQPLGSRSGGAGGGSTGGAAPQGGAFTLASQWLAASGQQHAHGGGEGGNAAVAAAGAVAAAAAAVGTEPPEALFRNQSAAGAFCAHALSQLASNLQASQGGGSAGGSAASGPGGQALEAVAAAVAAAAANAGGDPQTRNRILIQALQSVPLLAAQPFNVQVLQAAAAAMGQIQGQGQAGGAAAHAGNSYFLLPNMVAWSNQLLLGGLQAAGPGPAGAPGAEGGSDSAKMTRVMSAPVMQGNPGSTPVAAAGSPAHAAAGQIRGDATGNGALGAVAAAPLAIPVAAPLAVTATAQGTRRHGDKRGEASVNRAAANGEGTESVSAEEEAATKAAAEVEAAVERPAPGRPGREGAVALMAVALEEAFSVGPSDALEDDAAASEGLLPFPSAAEPTATSAAAARTPVAAVQEAQEGTLADARCVSPQEARGALPSSLRALATEQPAPPPPRSPRPRPSVTAAPAAASAVPPLPAEMGADGSQAMQLPYAVALVLPEDVEQQLLSRPVSSGSEAAPAGASAFSGRCGGSGSTATTATPGQQQPPQQQPQHQHPQAAASNATPSTVATASGAVAAYPSGDAVTAANVAALQAMLQGTGVSAGGGTSSISGGGGSISGGHATRHSPAGRAAGGRAGGILPTAMALAPGPLPYLHGTPLMPAGHWPPGATGLTAMSTEQLSSIAQMIPQVIASYGRPTPPPSQLMPGMPAPLLHPHSHPHILPAPYIPFSMPPPPPPPQAAAMSPVQQQSHQHQTSPQQQQQQQQQQQPLQPFDPTLLAGAAVPTCPGYGAHPHLFSHVGGPVLQQLAAHCHQQQQQQQLAVVHTAQQALSAQGHLLEAVAAAAAATQRRFSHDGSSAITTPAGSSTGYGTSRHNRAPSANALGGGAGGMAPATITAGDQQLMSAAGRPSGRGVAAGNVRRGAGGGGFGPFESASGTAGMQVSVPYHRLPGAPGAGGPGHVGDDTEQTLKQVANQLTMLQQKGALASSPQDKGDVLVHSSTDTPDAEPDEQKEALPAVSIVVAPDDDGGGAVTGSFSQLPYQRVREGQQAGPATATVGGVAASAPAAVVGTGAAAGAGSAATATAASATEALQAGAAPRIKPGAYMPQGPDPRGSGGGAAVAAPVATAVSSSAASTSATGGLAEGVVAYGATWSRSAAAEASPPAAIALPEAVPLGAVADAASTTIGNTTKVAASPSEAPSHLPSAAPAPLAAPVATPLTVAPVISSGPASQQQLKQLYAQLQPPPLLFAPTGVLMARPGSASSAGMAAPPVHRPGPGGPPMLATTPPPGGGVPFAASASGVNSVGLAGCTAVATMPAANGVSAAATTGAAGGGAAAPAGSRTGGASLSSSGYQPPAAAAVGGSAAQPMNPMRMQGAGMGLPVGAPATAATLAGGSQHMAPAAAMLATHPAAAIGYRGLAQDLMLGVSPTSSSPHMPPNLPPPPPPALAHNIHHSPPSWLYANFQRHGVAAGMQFLYDIKTGPDGGLWVHSPASSSQSPAHSLGSSAGLYGAGGGGLKSLQSLSAHQTPVASAGGAVAPGSGGSGHGAGPAPGQTQREAPVSSGSFGAIGGLMHPQQPFAVVPPHGHAHTRDPYFLNLEYTRAMVAAMTPAPGAGGMQEVAASSGGGATGGASAGGAAGVQGGGLSGQASGNLQLDEQLLFEVEGGTGSQPSSTSHPGVSYNGLSTASGAGTGSTGAVLVAQHGVAGVDKESTPGEMAVEAAVAAMSRQTSSSTTKPNGTLEAEAAGSAASLGAILAGALTATDSKVQQSQPGLAGGITTAIAAAVSSTGTGTAPGPVAVAVAAAAATAAMGSSSIHDAAKAAPVSSGNVTVSGSNAAGTPALPVGAGVGSITAAALSSSGSVSSTSLTPPEVLQHLTPPAVTPTSLSSSGSTPLSHSPQAAPLVINPTTPLTVGRVVGGNAVAAAAAAVEGPSQSQPQTQPQQPDLEKPVALPLQQKRGEQAPDVGPAAGQLPSGAASRGLSGTAGVSAVAPEAAMPPPPAIRIPSQKYDPLAAAAAQRSSSPGGTGLPSPGSVSAVQHGATSSSVQAQAADSAVVATGSSSPVAGLTTVGGLSQMPAPRPVVSPSAAAAQALLAAAIGAQQRDNSILLPAGGLIANASAHIVAIPAAAAGYVRPTPSAASAGVFPGLAAGAGSDVASCAGSAAMGAGDGALVYVEDPPTPSAGTPASEALQRPVLLPQPALAAGVAAITLAVPLALNPLSVPAVATAPGSGHASPHGPQPHVPVQVVPGTGGAASSALTGALTSARETAGSPAGQPSVDGDSAISITPSLASNVDAAMGLSASAAAQAAVGGCPEAVQQPSQPFDTSALSLAPAAASGDPRTVVAGAAQRKPGPYYPPNHPKYQPQQLTAHLHPLPPPQAVAPCAPVQVAAPATLAPQAMATALAATPAVPAAATPSSPSSPGSAASGVRQLADAAANAAIAAATAAVAAVSNAANRSAATRSDQAAAAAAAGNASAAASRAGMKQPSVQSGPLDPGSQLAAQAVRRVLSTERLPSVFSNNSDASVAAAAATTAAASLPGAHSVAGGAGATPPPQQQSAAVPAGGQSAQAEAAGAAETTAASEPASEIRASSAGAVGATLSLVRTQSPTGPVSSYLAAATGGSSVAGSIGGGGGSGAVAGPEAQPVSPASSTASGRTRASVDMVAQASGSGRGAHHVQQQQQLLLQGQQTQQHQQQQGSRQGSSNGDAGGSGAGGERSRSHHHHHGHHGHHVSHQHHHSSSHSQGHGQAHGHGRQAHGQGAGTGARDEAQGPGQGHHHRPHAGRSTPHVRHHAQQHQQQQLQGHQQQQPADTEQPGQVQDQEWQRVPSRRSGSAAAHNHHHGQHHHHYHHHHHHPQQGQGLGHHHGGPHHHGGGLGQHPADQEGRWQSRGPVGGAGGRGYGGSHAGGGARGHGSRGGGGGQGGGAAGGGAANSGNAAPRGGQSASRQQQQQQQQGRGAQRSGEERPEGEGHRQDAESEGGPSRGGRGGPGRRGG